MGYKIAEARKDKGWNQQQIARWETGQRDPKGCAPANPSASSRRK